MAKNPKAPARRPDPATNPPEAEADAAQAEGENPSPGGAGPDEAEDNPASSAPPPEDDQEEEPEAEADDEPEPELDSEPLVKIHSTLGADVNYTHPEGGVLIKGNPRGVTTNITLAQFGRLKAHPIFEIHRLNGHVKVHN